MNNIQYKTIVRDYLTRPRLSGKERMLICKRLAFLTQAGVSLPESIAMLREQARSKHTRAVLSKLHDDVTSGRSLSESLASFPHLFDTTVIYIVETGETTGTRVQTLTYLADILKKRAALKQKILNACIYPTIITVVMLAITGFLVLYLFPKIMPIFSSMHMDLPWPTRTVIAVSTFLMTWWLWCALAVIGCTLLVMFLVRQMPRVRYAFDTIWLRAPVIGVLIERYNLINSARTIRLLLEHMPLSRTLKRTAQSTTHTGYKKAWHDVSERVERGEALAPALASMPNYFPDTFVQLVAVGERSGTLTETLSFLGEWYESDIDELTKNLSTLVEPVLMIVMGCIIGFVALSIIMPIYSITQHLHG
jgi:type II secretory pathway component PulF